MKYRINMSPERVAKVVLACCILHNHVRRQENPSAVDHTEDNNIDPPMPRDDPFELGVGRPSQAAMDVRDQFARLFVTDLIVPWQYQRAHVAPPMFQNWNRTGFLTTGSCVFVFSSKECPIIVMYRHACNLSGVSAFTQRR